MKYITSFDVKGIYFVIKVSKTADQRQLKLQLCDEAFSLGSVSHFVDGFDDLREKTEKYVGNELPRNNFILLQRALETLNAEGRKLETQTAGQAIPLDEINSKRSA